MHYTRRQLGGLAAGALAARAQEGERKIGYAMVGLGRISMQHLAPSLKTSKTGTGYGAGERAPG